MPATLRSLRIRNLALVESLDWELSPGFSVVTGETGTGKSVIVGALKLVLGERADKSMIRTGADQCSVEAFFEVNELAELDQLLDEQGIDRCEGGHLLLKRIISDSEASRQFINGSQTTLGILKKLGDGLVDLHGPHDHQSLLTSEQQLVLVDSFAENQELLRKYQASYEALSELRRKREGRLNLTTAENLDLWHHQLEELEAANPQPSEFPTLLNRYPAATNARRLIEIGESVIRQLSEAEDSVLTRMSEIARLLREISRLDDSAGELLRAHEAAAIELTELERSIVAYRRRIEIDPEALQRMEERINLLQSLKRKHHRDENGLLELMQELQSRIDRVDHREELLSKIDSQYASESHILTMLGDRLTRSRLRAASQLSGSIRAHLKDLGFGRAGFEVRVDPLVQPRATGLETTEFLFAANPGEPLKPLRSVASSGEISRIMLAVKTALAQQDRVGLLVFDEIDANIGGEIAHSVGAKLGSLGESRQVIAITHMPQVAAVASRHFHVKKTVAQGRTRTSLVEVAKEDRIEELARMLGGRTKSAVDHARELLRWKQEPGIARQA